MVMGNLGCVFITGGVVPPFAVDRIGGFVLGASPNPPRRTDGRRQFSKELSKEQCLPDLECCKGTYCKITN